MKNNLYPYRNSLIIPKTDLKMKLTFLLLFISLFNINASSYSQNTKISLNLDNVTIESVFSEVMRKTDFKFLFSENEINLQRRVSVKVKKQRIEEILNILFSETTIAFQIVDKQIVLAKRVPRPNIEKKILLKTEVELQEVQNIVYGVITDGAGMPLPGVNVIIVGTTKGTQTDFDGNFSIEAKVGDTLQFSFLGMETQNVVVGTITNNINIVLLESNNTLDQIIVVGYGTQKKKSLSAAISQIEGKEIQTTTATSFAQKLSGKVAGLSIRETDGEPGSFRNSINIRGFGEPIYVIDGIRRGGGADFQRLNSEDIESISILKDASAAIYGLNAANGVIIVTTKKGGKGKAQFTYTSVVGYSSPTDTPTMANAAQYTELRNEANLNAGLGALFTNEELANWKAGGPGYQSTNWADETLLNNSVRYEHNISAQGGTEDVSYFINLGFLDDNGLLKSGDLNYKKYNFRSNLSAKLSKNVTTNFNISGIVDERNSPVNGIFNVWRGTVSSLPNNSVYANNNLDFLHRVQDGNAQNPVALAQSDLTGYVIAENKIFQTSFDLNYDVPFVKGLNAKFTVGYDPRFTQAKSLAKDFVLYDYDKVNETFDPTTFNKPSQIINDFNNSYLLTLQAQLNYKTVIADNHNVSGLFVFERREEEGRHANISKFFDFFTNAQIDQAGEVNAASSGNEIQVRNLSYIGKLNYDYKGKYLLELIARYDGSYRYHPDVRWGLFPSISVGWRVSDEKFMENISWLSNLKFRASYGTVGQDVGEPFQFIPAFSTSGGGTYEFGNGVLTNGAAAPSIVNKELTWMESDITDFGIDVGLFHNTLNITADVYQRDRTGLLAFRNVTIPNTFGGVLPQENLNSDRVQGLEFSMTYNNHVGDFNYSISGNYNLARTKNLDVESAPFTSSWDRYRSGQSNRWNDIVWQYNVLGQFQNQEEILFAPIQDGALGNSKELPGDFRYQDLNGDGVIDGNDYAPDAYDSTPKSNFGLTLSSSWRGFDFSALFQGAANFTARYSHAYTTYFWGDGNLPAFFADRWHKADYNDPNSAWIPGQWPAARVEKDLATQTYADSDIWRRDASYVRLKNIEIGYTMKQKAIQQIGINSIRMYTNLNNVYTWTDSFIKPFDPEKLTNSNSEFNAGWSYPLLMTINFGVNVKF